MHKEEILDENRTPFKTILMLTFVTLLKKMKRSVTRGTKKGHLSFKGQKTNLWLEELLTYGAINAT